MTSHKSVFDLSVRDGCQNDYELSCGVVYNFSLTKTLPKRSTMNPPFQIYNSVYFEPYT